MSNDPPFHFLPPQPASQGPVGRPPSDYLSILREVSGSVTSPIESFYLRLDQAVDRQTVARICRDQRVHVLEAFAVAMAWGGMRISNFRLAVGSQGLVPLLTNLRTSQNGLEDDYRTTQAACESIGGLRISFWSKLLHFFRRDGDAPILDQFTARSMNVIFPNSIRMNGNFPAADLRMEEYGVYIRLLEHLCARFGKGWTPIDMETALFDRRGGAWRKWVLSHCPTMTLPPRKVIDQNADVLEGGENAA